MVEFRVEQGAKAPNAAREGDLAARGPAPQTVNAWETETQIDTVEIAADAAAMQGSGATLASLSGLLKPEETRVESAMVETPGTGIHPAPPSADLDETPPPPPAGAVPEGATPGAVPPLPPGAGEDAGRGPATPLAASAEAPVAVASGPDLSTPQTAMPPQITLDGVDPPGDPAPLPQSVVLGTSEDDPDTTPAASPSESPNPPPPSPGPASPEAPPTDPATPDVIPPVAESPGDPSVIQDAPLPEDAQGPLTVARLDLDGAADAVFEITDAQGNPLVHPLFAIDGDRIVLRAGATPDFEAGGTVPLYLRAIEGDTTFDPVAVQIDLTDVAEIVTLGDDGVTFTDTGVTEIALRGGTGSDTITGSAGDDRISGGGGDDLIDAAAGLDTAGFSGSWADYDITRTGTDLRVGDTRDGTPDGIDTLSGVERLAFSDRTLTAEEALNRAPDLAVTGGTATEGQEGAQVATLKASDPNAGDALTLAVEDPRFEIAEDTLRLRDGIALDHETDGAAIDVTVTATDLKGATTEQVVRVEIEDKAERISLPDGGAAFTDTGVTETAVAGGNGADAITGSGGADTLSGGSGNDQLVGAAGDDDLTGGQGDDRIDGGAGLDVARWSGDLSGFSVALEDGTFTITDLLGRAGSDRVTGVEQFDFAGTLHDLAQLRIVAARQSDTPPDAPYLAGPGTVAEDAPAGTVIGRLLGGDPDGDAVTYRLTDAAGTPLDDPRFEIAGQALRIRPGADLDFETAPVQEVHVTARSADAGSAPTAITVTIADRAEVVQLADGGQIFTDEGLAETRVIGGDGADRITAAAGGLDMAGMDGDDILTGGWGDDRLDGGAGDDTLFGGGWDDTLLGGDGDDTLHGGTGFNRIDGGAGQDTATWDRALSEFEVSHDAATDRFSVVDPVALDYSDSVTGVEVFDFAGTVYTAAELRDHATRGDTRPAGPIDAGSDLGPPDPADPVAPSEEGASPTPDDPAPPLTPDTVPPAPGTASLSGTEGADTLIGGTGADRIFGGAGDDLLFGGEGAASDTLFGGTGDDELDGGAGDDTYVVGAGEDWTMISDGGQGWTDTLLLDGVTGPATVLGDTATGQGWTMMLDSGAVADQRPGVLDLTDDSAGLLSFDDGSAVDFIGLDRVAW
ncbi:hypothetical protein EU805_14830 [Salipiger sp. IMCC34102]|uniref:calcium-binding protein n=1 Tax=Salipiger sp. IMCC34102 TaxID=2510647 RepID=UPI00101BB525|nr:calcium-binding protein [Salipiger sp. IMCC34102]RYH01265.1 hypothetical protein EU805_14830 [Salipiger sp. IMCC34102]